MKRKKTAAERVWSVFRFLIISGLGFIILYPLIYMVSCTFRERGDMNDPTVVWLPRNFTFSVLKETVQAMDFPRTLVNTFVLNVVCTVFQIVSCALTGYGFARFDFKGKNILFGCVIATLIVPVQSFVVPLYKHFLGLKLLNTAFPILLLSAGGIGLKSGLYIFLFRQRFAGIPKELEESGKIDGAGDFRIFRSIMVPSALTIFVTCLLFSFVWQWTDNYYISVFMPTNKYLANMVSLLATISTDDYSLSLLTNAGVILLILPILFIFLIAQRFFVQGVETAGIVG